ncbi:MAG: hypothetical protein JNM70_17190 [Anaerolineae bacterium]|nr:hypothetical protein [Anaerolineae bacterium]
MTDQLVAERLTGAEEVVWDLSIFYASPDDPALQRDMDAVMQQAGAFADRYRGRVAELSAKSLLSNPKFMPTPWFGTPV